jgi:hypothetical protein
LRAKSWHHSVVERYRLIAAVVVLTMTAASSIAVWAGTQSLQPVSWLWVVIGGIAALLSALSAWVRQTKRKPVDSFQQVNRPERSSVITGERRRMPPELRRGSPQLGGRSPAGQPRGTTDFGADTDRSPTWITPGWPAVFFQALDCLLVRATRKFDRPFLACTQKSTASVQHHNYSLLQLDRTHMCLELVAAAAWLEAIAYRTPGGQALE